MNEFLLVEADEHAPQRLRRQALDLADSLVAKLKPDAAQDAKAIHEVRRTFKELRALTLLLGGTKVERKFFRDAGRELSRARDAKATLEAFDRLRERFASEWTPRQFGKIRRALAARVGRAADPEVMDRLRTALIAERGHIAAWPVDEMRRDDLWKGLARSYRRARRGMRQAVEDRTVEAIHEWRKRVKVHWYHTQFLTMVSLAPLEARTEALRKLSRRLGNHHDLVLIDETCRTTPDLFGSPRYVRKFRTFVGRELANLFEATESEGDDLFRESTREWIAASSRASGSL